ncbi:DUF1240 domain-containing protein [Proteus faecis]|uniref:DUF1240 domain-containing protein n=1 Tax=Proteus faecis TaxID=2050967 RepID=A0AAW7CU25_9GAMM|nr:DUF1240 domain-containing protein [Proteus faecis]MDL5167388.1 DUF1240 domain-containing protein [Proteus faecis]MDL5275371.1 DUF1240 domain-containing protein [Proteus faecis]MDL5278940.1 DUF1240 domain-containing protein [Proteus faecis]MDL5307940.1 DUF1240 domain-containing protein [Proteus faecis]MDL5311501.1 DUF1240 domain-containing protein [Proteus faecis]
MSGKNIIKIIYLVSGILFVFFSIELFISIESYVDYFSLSEKIRSSFKTSVFLFTVPSVFYLLYLLVFPPLKKRTLKGSKKIMFSFLLFFIFGCLFSFFFSRYVEKDLLSKGYVVCEKGSFAKSNVYVVSPMLCRD